MILSDWNKTFEIYYSYSTFKVFRDYFFLVREKHLIWTENEKWNDSYYVPERANFNLFYYCFFIFQTLNIAVPMQNLEVI